MSDTRTVRVGEARVTVINAGDMTLRLADEFAVPESLWRPQYEDLFDRPRLFPSLSALIQFNGATVLVDTNDYRATVTADSEYSVPDYTLPPSIPDQLISLGVRPEEVDHVVITHAHWDHFAGLTRPLDGGYVPTYPRARVYLGAADWDYEELRKGLADPASLETRTLGLLRERGMLELLAGARTLAPGIDVLPAPGETPGHQIVRIRSAQGETLYILGDLFHSEVEVERPDWMVTWAEPEPMLASRRRLMDDALAENALLIAAHIPSIGRLEQTSSGIRWQAVE
jgi:glyoxylase-like metal-dependent hydrolase (beta-lactamase superfamily II)